VPSRSIAEVGEFAFLASLVARVPRGRATIVGPGHDCAVVRSAGRSLLLTVDAMVEGVHFDRDWLSPRQIGCKSFLVNASDVAAMGGRPTACVVSVGVPATYRARDLSDLQAGVVAAARAVGASVVGGNLSRARQLFVSIALLADAPPRIVTRRGARPGDFVYVTGTLGDAALAVRLLQQRRPRSRPVPAAVLRRFREPAPRLRAGRVLVASGLVSAMIDVSDGLVQDLGHLCGQSRVGAVIRAATVPRSRAYCLHAGAGDTLALHGGEDYELLCTVPKRHVKRLQQARRGLGCRITCIGEITAERGICVVDASGQPMRLAAGGFDHFRDRD